MQALLDAIATMEPGADVRRIFHGRGGRYPGCEHLLLDAYPPVWVLTAFEPLDDAALQAVHTALAQRQQELAPEQPLNWVYQCRAKGAQETRLMAGEVPEPHVVQEDGTRYRVHVLRGQNHGFFPDMAEGRRWVRQYIPGVQRARVLNLFAYTCGIGTAAAKAGARQVVNVDFAQSSLAIGRQNADLNGLSTGSSFVKSDAFTALRQYAGLGQPQTVRGRRLPEFAKLAPQQFDLVFLDPPRLAKSPFGVVDLVRDYPALLKPALLATLPGGTLICCNNAAEMQREVWLEQVLRCAVKAGRPIREHQWIAPEADFPSPDGQPPLKILELRV